MSSASSQMTLRARVTPQRRLRPSFSSLAPQVSTELSGSRWSATGPFQTQSHSSFPPGGRALPVWAPSPAPSSSLSTRWRGPGCLGCRPALWRGPSPGPRLPGEPNLAVGAPGGLNFPQSGAGTASAATWGWWNPAFGGPAVWGLQGLPSREVTLWLTRWCLGCSLPGDQALSALSGMEIPR